MQFAAILVLNNHNDNNNDFSFLVLVVSWMSMWCAGHFAVFGAVGAALGAPHCVLIRQPHIQSELLHASCCLFVSLSFLQLFALRSIVHPSTAICIWTCCHIVACIGQAQSIALCHMTLLDVIPFAPA